MAKKLVAVTAIDHNGEVTPAGETLDASKFDKKQLEALYDAGAVRVDDGSSNDEAATETTQNFISADQSAEASSPVKATTTSSTKAAAETKETGSAKGSGK